MIILTPSLSPLQGKEVEVGVLRERVRQQEEAAKTLGEVLRKDAQQQVPTDVSFYYFNFFFSIFLPSLTVYGCSYGIKMK